MNNTGNPATQRAGRAALLAAFLAAASVSPLAHAQAVAKDAATLEFERFRAEMEDFGPSGLWEDKGGAVLGDPAWPQERLS